MIFKKCPKKSPLIAPLPQGPRMVLAGAGGVDHSKLCELAEKNFGKIGINCPNEVPIDMNCRYGHECAAMDVTWWCAT